MSNQPYAFISYSSKEYAEANNVRDVLNTNGVSCWMAPQSIEGGSDYTRSIPDAIANCAAVVLVCSQNAQDSYWVKSEIIEAISRQKPIVPFIIDNCQLNKEFNFMLSPAQRILAYENKAKAYETLISSVKGILNPRTAPTPAPAPPVPSPAPTPAPAVQKVVAVKKVKVSATACILCWVTFVISIVYAYIHMAMESGQDTVLPGSIFFLSPIMLVVTLIMLLFTHKHKSATVNEMNACRKRVALLYVITCAVMVLMDLLWFVRVVNYNITVIMTFVFLLLAVVEIILCIVTVVKFRRTQYVAQQ